MKSHLFKLLPLLSISACAYTPQTSMEHAQSSLNGKTFSVVTYKTLDAKIQTAGKTMLFGQLANYHFASEGARVMREDGVPDPAIVTSQQVASQLTKDYNMHQVGTLGHVYTGPETMVGVETDIPALLKEYPQGDYLVDIDSQLWWMIYNIGDGYKVIYRGYNRLIDRATGQPVATRTCIFNSNDDEDDHPSYDEMLANKSERLKQYFAKAASKCAAEFIQNLATPSPTAPTPKA